MNVLESDNIVTWLDVGHTLTNTLNDTSTLVSQNNWEGTLGILAGECVGIGVADTSVVDLYSDLVGLWWADLDVLNGEILASLPCDGGLAGNGLSYGIGGHFAMTCLLLLRMLGFKGDVCVEVFAARIAGGICRMM